MEPIFLYLCTVIFIIIFILGCLLLFAERNKTNNEDEDYYTIQKVNKWGYGIHYYVKKNSFYLRENKGIIDKCWYIDDATSFPNEQEARDFLEFYQNNYPLT